MNFIRTILSDLRLGLAAIRFRRTVSDLLSPDLGCPWDLQQSHASLRTYMIEEAFEAVDEMLADHQIDSGRLREELGDVLFQVFLNSELANRRGRFSIADVIESLNKKIIRRHPHVFMTSRRGKKISLDEVYREWKIIKQNEKRSLPPPPTLEPSERISRLHDLHALKNAASIGELSRELNFDWSKPADVLCKVEEELEEVEEAMASNGTETEKNAKVFEEIGDLLFSVVQLCRHLNFSSEDCLRAANRKFLFRFTKLLEKVKNSGKDTRSMTADELETVWGQIKKDSH